jgi:2-(1,2-epoxy-1,2-dihydrophenyl)acetyl-CoA isomerase
MSFYDESFDELITQKEGHLLWIHLNRPEAHNAITMEMIDSIEKVFRYADADPEVRVMILTGEGKSFCAGGDIKNMKEKKEMFEGESNELRLRYRNGIQRIPEIFHRLNTPIIAMVNGAAIGAGCDMVAMCDLAYASEKAKFGETFTKIGLIPGDGGTYYLQRKIGFSKAMEMYMTGDIYDAKQVNNIGLVNDIYSEKKLIEKTKEQALKVAAAAPMAQSMTKRALIHGYEANLTSQLDLLAAYQGITQRSHDHFEALEAIMDKKSPNFRNL